MVRAGLLVAMTPDGLIGRDGAMPWHFPEDLAHFKRTTLGGTVLMGRRTWESIGRPLPKRSNLVVSRTLAEGAGPDGRLHEGVRIFAGVRDACAFVDRERPGGDDFVWIIGGGQVYADVLSAFEEGAGDPVVERIVVTWVPALPLQDGDVLFPRDADWIARHFREHARWSGEDGRLEFVDYRRRA